MLTIGPSRLHPSPFLAAGAAAAAASTNHSPQQTRSRPQHQQQPSSSSSSSSRNSRGGQMYASPAAINSSSSSSSSSYSSTAGTTRARNKRGGGGGGGGGAARDGGAACPPPRLREERRNSSSSRSQRGGRGGGTTNEDTSSASPPANGVPPTTEQEVVLTSERQQSSGRRQQHYPSQQRLHSTQQRKWTKGGGGAGGGTSSSGSGPNSPRPPQQHSSSGARANGRRRRSNRSEGGSELGNHQNRPALDLSLTSPAPPRDPSTSPLIKGEPEENGREGGGERGGGGGGGGGGDGRTRRKKSTPRNKRSRGNITMSSIDSGKGEDLSSSCESSVFDPLTPSIQGAGSLGERSNCSSCSSNIDDEFHDALSHPPSDDDGVNSSAFVTPSTTPPHSPRPRPLSPGNHRCHGNDTEREPLSLQTPPLLSSPSSQERLRVSLDRISRERKRRKSQSRDLEVESHDQAMESRDGHVIGHVEKETGGGNLSEVVSQSNTVEIETSREISLAQASSSLTDVRLTSNSGGRKKREEGGGREKEEEEEEVKGRRERGTSGRKGRKRESTKRRSSSRNSRGSIDNVTDSIPSSSSSLVMSSSAVMMSSSGGHHHGNGLGSGSDDTSPQSSISSNNLPRTPPLISSPSHSPSPSTPSQHLHSPSPVVSHIPPVSMDTVSMDTVTTTTTTTGNEVREDEWPLLVPEQEEVVSTESHHQNQPQQEDEGLEEEEWPDLHSPQEFKVQQPTESTEEEVGGQVSEPHPQNAAAAYPHMIHPPPPFAPPPHHPPPHMGWSHYYPPPPPHLQHTQTSTGSYSYYPFPLHPSSGYYTSVPSGGPANFMWPQHLHHGPPHVGPPPTSVPVLYAYSGSSMASEDATDNKENSSGCDLDLTETPPTNRDTGNESGEEMNEDVVTERLGEGGEGEGGGGGEGIEEEENKDKKEEEDEEEVVVVEKSVEKVDKEEREEEEEVGGGGGGGGDVEREVPEEEESREEEGGGEEGDNEPEEEGEVEDKETLSQEEEESPIEIAIVPSHHPLQSTWVMWYDRITGNTRNCRSDYRSSLKNIFTVTSVEDFWQLYNNIRQPSGLERNSNYHFFKEGVEPLWEDPANEQGGKWVLTLKDEVILDRVWEELLLAMIGGVIQNSHAINGAVVSRRKKGERIALWTSKKSAKVNLSICVDLLRVLVIACNINLEKIPEFIRQLVEGGCGLSLEYMYHRDSLRSGTSYQNSGHINLVDNSQSLIDRVQKQLSSGS